MGNINKEGIAQARKLRQQRKDALTELTSTAFNLDDAEQQLKLKKYIDDFELSVNKMYVYQALAKGVTAWAGSWLVNRLLPVPDIVNSLFTVFLYFGVAAALVKHFSMTDFLAQQDEMEKIYNWCLKNNQENYVSTIDNTQKLNSPLIQRLIKLLAPLCSPKFMITWPKEVTTPTEDTSGWGKTLSAGYSALSATLSIFSRAPSPEITLDQQRLKELKIKVEKEELNLNAFTGLEQAIRYFGNLAANTDYKALLASKVKKPLEMLQDTASTVVQESFHPKRP